MLSLSSLKLWRKSRPMIALMASLNSQILFGHDRYCDLQFFGDFFISEVALREMKSLYGHDHPLESTSSLLNSCYKNVVNFEGVATNHETPLEPKDYLLKMPIWIPHLLAKNGISALTLANNHSMDFGLLGLRDTLTQAALNGIQTLGAHEIPEKATKPAKFVLGESNREICLGAFSSTYPKSFWAEADRGGTAYASYLNIKRTFRQCQQSSYKIAVFHWGEERNPQPHDLQRSLAEFSINLGFDLVIGHHPHVIQPFNIYLGKPIFYSLGNFAFATRPLKSVSEGISLRLHFNGTGENPTMIVVPLNVNNDIVHFNPRGFHRLEKTEAERNLRSLLRSINDKNFENNFFYHEKWGWTYRINSIEITKDSNMSAPKKNIDSQSNPIQGQST